MTKKKQNFNSIKNLFMEIKRFHDIIIIYKCLWKELKVIQMSFFFYWSFLVVSKLLQLIEVDEVRSLFYFYFFSFHIQNRNNNSTNSRQFISKKKRNKSQSCVIWMFTNKLKCLPNRMTFHTCTPYGTECINQMVFWMFDVYQTAVE